MDVGHEDALPHFRVLPFDDHDAEAVLTLQTRDRLAISIRDNRKRNRGGEIGPGIQLREKLDITNN